MSGPRTKAGRALLEAGHVPPCPWKSQGSMGRGDCDCPSRVAAIESQAREPALALLRLLGADRECIWFVPGHSGCMSHLVPADEVPKVRMAPFSDPTATRCTVGAAWDALEVKS